jgi:hypothetical protein
VGSLDDHNGKQFIRVYDLKHGTSTRLTDGDEHYPSWSRDGKRIAYRTGGVASNSYEIAADGSGPPKILLTSDVGGVLRIGLRTANSSSWPSRNSILFPPWRSTLHRITR